MCGLNRKAKARVLNFMSRSLCKRGGNRVDFEYEYLPENRGSDAGILCFCVCS